MDKVADGYGVALAIVVLVILLGVGYAAYQYGLCRDMDFGRMYCLRHAGIL